MRSFVHKVLIGIVLLFLVCTTDAIEAPPRPLSFCDSTEFNLTAAGFSPLRTYVEQPSFIYENAGYSIYIEPATLLRRLETNLAWRNYDNPTSESEAYSMLLKKMWVDLLEHKHIDIKRYKEIEKGAGLNLEGEVGNLVEKGDVAVIDDYWWCENDYCPHQLTSVSRWTLHKKDFNGTVFCDPDGGMVYFNLAPPVVY